MAQAHAALDLVEAEERRLEGELAELSSGGTGVIGFFDAFGAPFGLDVTTARERAADYQGLIEQLERFVIDTYSRVEAKALATQDIARARTLRDATLAILGNARTATPTNDLVKDAKDSVKNTVDDLEGLINKLVKAVGVGTAVFLSVKLLELLTPRR